MQGKIVVYKIGLTKFMQYGKCNIFHTQLRMFLWMVSKLWLEKRQQNLKVKTRVAEPEPEPVGTVFIWGHRNPIWNTVPVRGTRK